MITKNLAVCVALSAIAACSVGSSGGSTGGACGSALASSLEPGLLRELRLLRRPLHRDARGRGRERRG